MKEVKNFLEKNLTSLPQSGIIKGEWNEEDHPRDDNGRFTSGGASATSEENGEHELSPTGTNTFEVRDFRSKQKLNNHWKDHAEEYKKDENIKSKEDYLKRALTLLESPTGESILGHVDGKGNVIRYDTSTNDFAKGCPKRGVTTMFKAPQTYYESQKGEDIKHGGKA